MKEMGRDKMTNVHSEVLIKVNAWVDKRIAPIVEALNAFSIVETFSSCQGDGHIYFNVRGEPRELFSFIEDLANALTTEIGNNCCAFKLRLEWLGSNPAHGALYVTDEALDSVACGLMKIARKTLAHDTFSELARQTANDSAEMLRALE